ncbi:MAG TPA: hypothetical protein VGK25_07700 [Ignavibacteria bacterium]
MGKIRRIKGHFSGKSRVRGKLSNANKGKSWTTEEVKELKKLAKKNAPTVVMEIVLQRSKDSIYAKASKEGISLKAN